MTDIGTKLTWQLSPLASGNYVQSPTGACSLTMETTGDLVASSPGTWHAGTGGNNGAYCAMTRTGDLIVYNSSGSALKHSKTTGYNNAYLGIDDSGNVNIYDASGNVLFTNFQMYAFTPSARVAALFESAKTAVGALHDELSRLQSEAGQAADPTAEKTAPYQNGNGGPRVQPRA
jgi:hypothetical protein